MNQNTVVVKSHLPQATESSLIRYFRDEGSLLLDEFCRQYQIFQIPSFVIELAPGPIADRVSCKISVRLNKWLNLRFQGAGKDAMDSFQKSTDKMKDILHLRATETKLKRTA